MTDRHRLEVADVFRQYGEDYLDQYGASRAQRRVLRDIQACRTAALGGHVARCDRCGHQTISYNSCRNRHCPKCQGPARARWLDARAAELLPVPYFHVVFTVPEVLGPLALQNKRRGLQRALSSGGRHTPGSGGQPETPGSAAWHPGRAAHLGPEPAAPPASTLCGAGRWPGH